MVRKLAAVVIVAVAFVVAEFAHSQASVTTTKPVSAVDLSSAPRGWVPVAYGDAQVSVPATWDVLTNAWCGRTLPPIIQLGKVSQSISCPTAPPPPTVQITPLGSIPAPYRNGHPVVLDGISVLRGPKSVASISYFVPSLSVELSARGAMGTRVIDTLAASPRTVVLASGAPPVVPSSWQSVSFAGLRLSVPADWPVTQTSGAADGLGNPCEAPGVAFLVSGVTLSTDQHLLPPPACAKGSYENAPQPPMNGAQVDSGSHVQFHVSLSFPKHCLDLHGLTACPATSPAYSILVLKVTVPGRKTPVYVSIGLAGNGMVAKTILYSLRPATASVSKAATSTTVSHWWVTLVFANSRLGVVAEGSGVEQAAHCDLSVYATSDGGASWAVRVLLTRRASCQAGGSTDQMAITTDGHWLLATPQGLFIGQVNHPGSELVQATHLDRSTPTKAICSVAASGSSVWLTLAETCGLRSPSVLLYSGDDGATWTRRTVPLGFFVDFVSTFATPPDSLAATDPESLWLLGSATSRSPPCCSPDQGRGPDLGEDHTALQR